MSRAPSRSSALTTCSSSPRSEKRRWREAGRGAPFSTNKPYVGARHFSGLDFQGGTLRCKCCGSARKAPSRRSPSPCASRTNTACPSCVHSTASRAREGGRAKGCVRATGVVRAPLERGAAPLLYLYSSAARAGQNDHSPGSCELEDVILAIAPGKDLANLLVRWSSR